MYRARYFTSVHTERPQQRRHFLPCHPTPVMAYRPVIESTKRLCWIYESTFHTGDGTCSRNCFNYTPYNTGEDKGKCRYSSFTFVPIGETFTVRGGKFFRWKT